MLPTVTLLGIGIGHMLSGAVFAEIVFARPGVGKLVYDAINARNYPLVSGTVLITTAFYVLARLSPICSSLGSTPVSVQASDSARSPLWRASGWRVVSRGLADPLGRLGLALVLCCSWRAPSSPI